MKLAALLPLRIVRHSPPVLVQEAFPCVLAQPFLQVTFKHNVWMSMWRMIQNINKTVSKFLLTFARNQYFKKNIELHNTSRCRKRNFDRIGIAVKLVCHPCSCMYLSSALVCAVTAATRASFGLLWHMFAQYRASFARSFVRSRNFTLDKLPVVVTGSTKF